MVPTSTFWTKRGADVEAKNSAGRTALEWARERGAQNEIGSFVTAKAEPNDVDIVLLMENTFDLATLTGEAALVFQHPEAHGHFGASVFWTRRSGAIGGEQAMVEYWQVRREGGQRGIVEIVSEGS
jgi:hypothetical protein